MTDTGHRTYAVAIALVVFFFAWATIAATLDRPHPIPGSSALQVREQRPRADARIVARNRRPAQRCLSRRAPGAARGDRQRHQVAGGAVRPRRHRSGSSPCRR